MCFLKLWNSYARCTISWGLTAFWWLPEMTNWRPAIPVDNCNSTTLISSTFWGQAHQDLHHMSGFCDQRYTSLICVASCSIIGQEDQWDKGAVGATHVLGMNKLANGAQLPTQLIRGLLLVCQLNYLMKFARVIVTFLEGKGMNIYGDSARYYVHTSSRQFSCSYVAAAYSKQAVGMPM